MNKRQVSRRHHYVPEWYQRRFTSPFDNKLHYLNLSPDPIHLPDGSIKTHKALRRCSPAQCFYCHDLYSLRFLSEVSDAIEKHLFGIIDTNGARAVAAILGTDPNQWHRQFENFFIFLDAQKLRTPTGLNWLTSHYHSLSQNDLMMEMQEVRASNCTIWSECVREIVSARESETKFVITDHSITIYNYACPPDHPLCTDPNDPSITLKASQTIVPLDQHYCLILTNLEYADTPSLDAPLEPRTFPRRFRESLVRTDKFIRTRSMDDHDVSAINHVLKARANRYIAAGHEKDLYPEEQYKGTWSEIRKILLPPTEEIWQFRGETFVKYADGRVHYQDAYGRTNPASEAFSKHTQECSLKPTDVCGCGSGREYGKCCKGKATALRPSWNELSIRERNLIFRNALHDILEINGEVDWTFIRRTLNEEKVVKIHKIYGTLWPPETDIFDLLPKPDGTARAVYSGIMDPIVTPLIVANSNLHFGEILIQGPFVNHHQVREEFSPLTSPQQYLVKTLGDVLLFFQLLPWIEYGSVNLIPDPCSFDPYLQSNILSLAQNRYRGRDAPRADQTVVERFVGREMGFFLLSQSEEEQRRMIVKAAPDASEECIRGILGWWAKMREANPLIPLQDGVFDDRGSDRGGQLRMVQMSPNFEMWRVQVPYGESNRLIY